MTITRLHYEITYCSTWDPDHPPGELVVDSPTSPSVGENGKIEVPTPPRHVKGWQTSRRCSYPQELILRLSGPCRIAKLQILSHHFKIATKIEVYIGNIPQPTHRWSAKNSKHSLATARSASTNGAHHMIADHADTEVPTQPESEGHLEQGGLDDEGEQSDDEGPSSTSQSDDDGANTEDDGPLIEFVRLGYVSLDSNKGANFKARELKSIKIDAEGEYVRLVIRKYHQNGLNQYNQVGIVAINILGEPKDDDLTVDSIEIPFERHQDLTNPSSDQSILLDSPNLNTILGYSPATQFSASKGSAHVLPGGAFLPLGPHLLHTQLPLQQNPPPQPTTQQQALFVLDEELRDWFKALVKAKEDAVKMEDFHAAKLLKQLLDMLSHRAEEMAKLDAAKRKAVEAEDYDEADRLKAEFEDARVECKREITQSGIMMNEYGDVVAAIPEDDDDDALMYGEQSTEDDLQQEDEEQSQHLPDSDYPVHEHSSRNHSPSKHNRRRAHSPNKMDRRPTDDYVTPVEAPYHPPASPVPMMSHSSPLYTDLKYGTNLDSREMTRSPELELEDLMPSTSPVPEEVDLQPMLDDDDDVSDDARDPAPPKPLSPRRSPKGSRTQKVPATRFHTSPSASINPGTPFLNPPIADDDRPLPALTSATKPSPFADSVAMMQLMDDSNEGSGTEPDEPEELTADQRREFELPIHVFGERVIACLLSKKFRLREYALTQVTRRVEGRDQGEEADDEDSDAERDGEVDDGRWRRRMHPKDVDKVSLSKATFPVIQEGLNDSRERVSIQALALWESLTTFCVDNLVPTPNIYRNLEQTLHFLLNKTADMNPRIKQPAIDLIVNLSNAYRSPPCAVLPLVVHKHTKAIQNHKQAKARVELVKRLVEEFGVAAKGEQTGITLDAVMDFSLAYLNHNHNEVRDATVNLVVEISKKVGIQNVDNYLRDAKPALAQTIRRLVSSAEEKSSAKGAVPAAKENEEPQTPTPPAVTNKASKISPPPPAIQVTPAPVSPAAATTSTSPVVPVAPRRGTVAKLEQQLAELKAMVAQAGLTPEERHHAHAQAAQPVASTSTEVSNARPAAKEVSEDEDDDTEDAAPAPTAAGKTTKTTKVSKSSPSAVPAPLDKERNKVVKDTTARRKKPIDEEIDENNGAERRKNAAAPKTPVRANNTTKSTLKPTARRSSIGSTVSISDVVAQPTKAAAAKTTTKTAKTGAKQEKAAPVPSPSVSLQSNGKTDNVCIFCDEHNDAFNEDTLVVHYWNDCPILTNCPLCKIILEISTLTEHVLTDCEERQLVKQCLRCREIIPVDHWLQHSLKQNCPVVTAEIARCPLCHVIIDPPTEAGWKEHLLEAEGCPHNPRRIAAKRREVNGRMAKDPKAPRTTEKKKKSSAVASIESDLKKGGNNSSATRIPKTGPSNGIAVGGTAPPRRKK